MSRAMKVVVAYDGSECADKAIESLRYAGIPDASEVTVISVSEWFPVPVAVGGSELLTERPLGNQEEAIGLAEIARKRLAEEHPHWTVRSEGFFGSPAREIVRYADEHGAELIVTGSHGRSAFGRFFLGSISHQILTSAQCDVRIARNGYQAGPSSSLTILLAIDGSDYSEAIFEAVLHRSWPQGTRFVVVSAAEYGYEEEEEETMMERLHALHKEIGGRLKEKGFEMESIIDTGMVHPREVIMDVAETAKAECIILGARGLTGFERFVLGSVSITVAMRAHCSVEIIHHKVAANDQ